jgi:thiosulfate/3-mercaptopyruvate sulfurtransferase
MRGVKGGLRGRSRSLGKVKSHLVLKLFLYNTCLSYTGLSSGHMPHSLSIPISDLLDPTFKTLLPASQLKEVFRTKGIDPLKPIINSCGTGVTAAVIDAALVEAGFPTDKTRLYDGSWTEWAQRVDPSDSLIRKKE